MPCKKIYTCEKSDGLVNFDKTRNVISEIDVKADKLKKKILESKSKYKTKGNIYFVSPTGNDANDGLSPVTAWKTLMRVHNAPELLPGDVVLFQRGAMFRGNGIFLKAGVTYSAYGEGAKPVINCSPEDGAGASNWKRLSGTNNIWVYKNKLADVGNIIFDGGATNGVKKIPDYHDGKYYVRSEELYSEEFDVKKHLTKNFDFFSECDKCLTDSGMPACFNNENNTGSLYLYCDMGNPGAVFSSIEFAINKSGLCIRGNNITVDNLCIMYAGIHGVASGTTENLTVRNCVFGWIGGAIHMYNASGRCTRLGNGIEIYGGCKNFLVENNYIYQCYDCGATHQYASGGTNSIAMEKAVYRNNLIEYCIYSIEYFLGVARDDCDAVRYMKGIYIYDNIMRYAGFGFGEQRPDKKTAAHIKSWDHYNKATDFVIENNIMDRSRHMLVHISAFEKEWLPESRNNTYIQYLNHTGTFGRYDIRPSANLPYSEDIKKVLSDKGIEKDANIYFAENDEICEIPVQ